MYLSAPISQELSRVQTCALHTIFLLINVSIQSKVPTHPRSAIIKQTSYTGIRPFAVSQGKRQKLTYLSWAGAYCYNISKITNLTLLNTKYHKSEYTIVFSIPQNLYNQVYRSKFQKLLDLDHWSVSGHLPFWHLV